MNNTRVAELARTETQKMVRNGYLVVWCRNAWRATSQPGQPSSTAIVWRVESGVRRPPAIAADVSAAYITTAALVSKP